MNRRIQLGLMISTLLIAAACSSEPKQTQPVTTTSGNGTSSAAPAKDATAREKAFVRVINAEPGNTAFDIFADDQKIFNSVAFKSVTPYTEVPDQRYTFRLRPAGQNSAQPAAENSEGLGAGKHYTIVVMPDNNNKTTFYIVNDNLTNPATDAAQLRVIHASPDAGEIDVVNKQDNKKLFSGVNFEKDTNYTNVDPTKKVTLEVRQEGQQQPILTVPSANFEKGKFYTIVVIGRVKGTPKLQTLTVEDQLGNATAANPPKDKIVKTRYQ
jgi:hypothetical protein